MLNWNLIKALVLTWSLQEIQGVKEEIKWFHEATTNPECGTFHKINGLTFKKNSVSNKKT